MRPLRDADTQVFGTMLGRRRQVVAILVVENRLSRALPEVHLRSRPISIGWGRSWTTSTANFDKAIQNSPVWRGKDELLRSVPGVGPQVSMALQADPSELGTLSRKKIAALVGVAPCSRDSERHRGKRTTWGSRARVRSVLYKGTLLVARCNPVIREFYQRLLAARKPKKLALTACMRKLLTVLNSMVKLGMPGIPPSGRLQSQEIWPRRRAMVWVGRKAQVLARRGMDIRRGNHPAERRALSAVLTRVANIPPSPGRRSVWRSSSQLRSFT